MDTRFITATLVGAVVLFAAGFLIWGVALAGFVEAHTDQSIILDPPRWAFLVIQQIAFAGLLAYIFDRWAGIKTWQTGMQQGAILGLIIGIAVDFGIYSMTTISDLTLTLVDPVAAAVHMALGGAAVGAMLGRGDS